MTFKDWVSNEKYRKKEEAAITFPKGRTVEEVERDDYLKLVSRTHEEYAAKKWYEYEREMRLREEAMRHYDPTRDAAIGGMLIKELTPTSAGRAFTTMVSDEYQRAIPATLSKNVEVDKDLMMRLLAHVRTLQETVDEALRNK